MHLTFIKKYQRMRSVMKKLIYIYSLFLSLGINYAQQASDYFPEYPYARWEYKITVLDSLSNEIDSLSYYRHDKIIDETIFKGKLAKILQTKSGPAETIHFQPYLDSIFLHFSGTDAYEYFKLGYIKILLTALDSVLNLPDFNFVDFLTSFENWYSVYRFNQTVNDEYTIFQFDTSILVDNVTLPLRLDVQGVRLEDDSISIPFGGFVCKKFQRVISLSVILTPPILPPVIVTFFSLEDYIWIAEDYWIVRGLIPPINVDLSELNMNLPSFYIPGLITELEYTNIITSVEEDLYIPDEITLSQNYPNPFNPSTKIRFTIPAAETVHAPSVQLIVYDVLGNEVAILVNEEKPAGTYEVEFNSHSGAVRDLASGVYFYQLKIHPANGGAERIVETKKMILLR
jgi:hypothetical protein